MKSHRAAASRLAGAIVFGAPCLAAPGLVHAAAADLFYERTVMSVADARCGLFDPALGSALNAARAQARGAALRSGVEAEDLAAVELRATTKAREADCSSKDVATAAARVRTAFDGFQRLTAMDYPGDMAVWKADRSVAKFSTTWSVLQTTSFGWNRAAVGVVSGDDGLTAVGAFADDAEPYAARLVLRDPRRTSRPYLDRRQADAAGRMPLAARLPPPSATRTFNAAKKTAAPDTLLPDFGRKTALKAGWAFRFPVAATEALAQLDPRESVAVDFVFATRGRDAVRRAYVEVGDFAAGRAFVHLAQR